MKKILKCILSIALLVGMINVQSISAFDYSLKSESIDNVETEFESSLESLEDMGGVDIEDVDKELIDDEEAEEEHDELLENNEKIGEYTIKAEDDSTQKVVLVNADKGVSILNKDTNEYKTLELNKNGDLEVETVEIVDGKTIKNSATITSVEEDVVTGQGWNSVVKETYKNKYWYQNSETGKYVRVGCQAKYKINYDKLSNSKVYNVNTYRSNVSKTKSNWKAYNKACKAVGINGNLALALIVSATGAGLVTGGVGFIIGIVSGLFVGITYDQATKVGSYYFETEKAFDKVQSYYLKIRKYGTKY